jgi:hypothetical protein
MRRANAALDEAHEATRDRTEDWDREVFRAVGEYNNALKEVQRLLERATLYTLELAPIGRSGVKSTDSCPPKD